MTTNADMDKTIHHGRNIKRYREMLGIKQEALAYQLGDDWNQKKYLLLNKKKLLMMLYWIRLPSS